MEKSAPEDAAVSENLGMNPISIIDCAKVIIIVPKPMTLGSLASFFAVTEPLVAAYEFCNLHGLRMAKA